MENKNNSKNLFELIQNSVVSAIALHAFTVGYNSTAKRQKSLRKYPKLEYLFYVLPIVYHQRSLNTFLISFSVRRVLEKDHSITLGLQDRAVKMINQTYDGLNVAFSKNILSLNKENMTIELMYDNGKGLPLPQSMINDDLLKIQRSARNLGSIFSKTNERNIQTYLNIRF